MRTTLARFLFSNRIIKEASQTELASTLGILHFLIYPLELHFRCSFHCWEETWPQHWLPFASCAGELGSLASILCIFTTTAFPTLKLTVVPGYQSPRTNKSKRHPILLYFCAQATSDLLDSLFSGKRAEP